MLQNLFRVQGLGMIFGNPLEFRNSFCDSGTARIYGQLVKEVGREP